MKFFFLLYTPKQQGQTLKILAKVERSNLEALVETEIMGVARSVGFPLMHWRISASRSSEKVRKKTLRLACPYVFFHYSRV